MKSISIFYVLKSIKIGEGIPDTENQYLKKINQIQLSWLELNKKNLLCFFVFPTSTKEFINSQNMLSGGVFWLLF